MKKSIFLAIALPIAAIIAVTSCTKDVNEANEIKNESNLLTLKSFERYGQIHNEILTRVYNDYEISVEIKDYKEAVNHISDFIKQSFLESKLLETDEKISLTTSIYPDNYKYFVDNKMFVNKLSANNTKMNVDNVKLRLMSESIDGDIIDFLDSIDFNIYEQLDSIYACGLVDSFEYDKLKIITDNIYANMIGEISDSEFDDCILYIAKQWEKMGYTEDSQLGKVLGSTLAIGIASHEKKKKNPSAISENKPGGQMVLQAGPVATDAAGALVGGVIALIRGNDIIAGALWTGGIASTGLIGKVAKWLANLF